MSDVKNEPAESPTDETSSQFPRALDTNIYIIERVQLRNLEEYNAYLKARQVKAMNMKPD